MTKYITIDKTAYTLETCTAICLADLLDGKGEAARQHALHASYVADSGERIEHVVFGWLMPDDAADLLAMASDSTAWESDQDVLATVRQSPRYIKVSVSGWRTGHGWDYQNADLDPWELDEDQRTMTQLPAEATEWMTTALFGEQPEEDELLHAADDTATDTQITIELVEELPDMSTETLDTKSAWASELAKAYLAKYSDRRTWESLAEQIRSLDTWDHSLCAALCAAANMTDEWDAADGDTYESVVLAAAKKLGVEIL